MIVGKNKFAQYTLQDIVIHIIPNKCVYNYKIYRAFHNILRDYKHL